MVVYGENKTAIARFYESTMAALFNFSINIRDNGLVRCKYPELDVKERVYR